MTIVLLHVMQYLNLYTIGYEIWQGVECRDNGQRTNQQDCTLFSIFFPVCITYVYMHEDYAN